LTPVSGGVGVSDPYDAVVVGAGPAGLTAAIYLGRFRRRVLVLHDGEPRAAWIPRTRNFPGWPDGITGVELLQRMTEQAERYGAVIEQRRVEAVREADSLFRIEAEGGAVTGRRLVIATGVSDNEPPLPGIERAVARGLVRICPICDAYEVSDQDVGILGCGDTGAREALFLKTYTDRVTLVHTGAPEDLSEDHRRALATAGVEIVETPLEAVEIQDERVLAFTWSGAVRRFDTVYSALGVTPRAELALTLGAERSADGRITTGDHQTTSVPGLYCAGDVVRGLNQLTVAMAEAALAAVHIHNSLREAEGQTVEASLASSAARTDGHSSARIENTTVSRQ
jgi:thioredoxin reductase (NADPH)